jgi:hypothetical protein
MFLKDWNRKKGHKIEVSATLIKVVEIRGTKMEQKYKNIPVEVKEPITGRS